MSQNSLSMSDLKSDCPSQNRHAIAPGKACNCWWTLSTELQDRRGVLETRLGAMSSVITGLEKAVESLVVQTLGRQKMEGQGSKRASVNGKSKATQDPFYPVSKPQRNKYIKRNQ